MTSRGVGMSGTRDRFRSRFSGIKLPPRPHGHHTLEPILPTVNPTDDRAAANALRAVHSGSRSGMEPAARSSGLLLVRYSATKGEGLMSEFKDGAAGPDVVDILT